MTTQEIVSKLWNLCNVLRDLLVGHLGNSRIQLLGGKALPIQRQAQGAQPLAGQLLRPCADNVQGGDLIQIGLDIVCERVQIIFGLAAAAVASGMLQKLGGQAEKGAYLLQAGA